MSCDVIEIAIFSSFYSLATQNSVKKHRFLVENIMFGCGNHVIDTCVVWPVTQQVLGFWMLNMSNWLKKINWKYTKKILLEVYKNSRATQCIMLRVAKFYIVLLGTFIYAM